MNTTFAVILVLCIIAGLFLVPIVDAQFRGGLKNLFLMRNFFSRIDLVNYNLISLQDEEVEEALEEEVDLVDVEEEVLVDEVVDEVEEEVLEDEIEVLDSESF